jgi:uncharacterized protein (TIGR02145 family)
MRTFSSRQKLPIFEFMKNLIPILLAVVVLSSGCDSAATSTETQPANCGDLVSHEGYDYSTVQIGEQCWFSENCRYLPRVSPSSEGNYTNPYYYVYGYEGTEVAEAKTSSNYETYGVLYNWTAVMKKGLCPSGWHFPTDAELTHLTDYLGGKSIAGYALKSNAGWNAGGNGSNDSGFNGLPGGYFYCHNISNDYYKGFIGIGNVGYWWSSSESDSLSWDHSLASNGDYFDRDSINYLDNGIAKSARCIRD